jgi:predicted ABC-type ATPase
MPKMYIISGCNGAGKTTASFTVLPEMLLCNEFVNADEIAKGLSPFNPEGVAIEAGRIQLTRIRELMAQQRDFAFETTLASRVFASYIMAAREAGYTVNLLYFWLQSPDLAIERVRARVLSGGHHIPDHIIQRRYYAGLKNLLNLYMPICDYWMIIDNSAYPFEFIAKGNKAKDVIVYNDKIYHKILSHEPRR